MRKAMLLQDLAACSSSSWTWRFIYEEGWAGGDRQYPQRLFFTEATLVSWQKVKLLK